MNFAIPVIVILNLMALTIPARATCYVSNKLNIQVGNKSIEGYVSVGWYESAERQRRVMFFDKNFKQIASSELANCGNRPPYWCGLEDDGGMVNVLFHSEPPKKKTGDGIDHLTLNAGKNASLKVRVAQDDPSETHVVVGRKVGPESIDLTRTPNTQRCPEGPEPEEPEAEPAPQAPTKVKPKPSRPATPVAPAATS